MVPLITPASATALAAIALAASALLACAHVSAEGARPAPAAPPRGLFLDERFETARPVPALGIYEQLSPALLAQLEAGGRWHLILDPDSSATAEIADGQAKLEIHRAGGHWYSVQLAYLPVQLRPGMRYRVTFRARASRPLVTTFDLAHVGDGWKSYSGRLAFELDVAWREHELRFETGPGESEEHGRFELNFGNEGKSVIRPGDEVRVDRVQVFEEARGAP